MDADWGCAPGMENNSVSPLSRRERGGKTSIDIFLHEITAAPDRPQPTGSLAWRRHQPVENIGAETCAASHRKKALDSPLSK